jgi:16S rRNA (cytosine1402-N4)-methyltransferase
MQTHKSVLLKEVLYFLDPIRGKKYIDATVGGAGHTIAVLKKGGKVLGLDQDPKSLEVARDQILACPGTFEKDERTFDSPQKALAFQFDKDTECVLIHSNFTSIEEVAKSRGWNKVDGVLLDLGFASFQIDDAGRGLSFLKDGPLDMRLDPALGVTARDLINGLPEGELERLFREWGEERYARTLARVIVRERAQTPITQTAQLAQLIKDSYPGRFTGKKTIHPATKVFMALRMAVNSERENLISVLPQAFNLLGKGGKLCIISFHSGEDRLVKEFFKEKEKEKLAEIQTKKPITPSIEEEKENPRARSAKMRVLKRT